MAYDEALASRIRSLLAERDGVREQKMFGGLAFLVGDKMAAGIIGDDLMVRVGPDAYDEALAQPHARPMDFTGRPLKGMVYVAPAGIGTEPDLARWVEAGVEYAGSLVSSP
mgnify:CR=1 FL=1